ncbi:DUF4188 domain-containing protein (plasmid) [Deinococcus taeanensis]|uniref:DUF4188 domain-containing protein n=1 Tax=Deinococcus taeanensis TaxID=2737050 RepID=UPI001CDB8F53|nr:DUF4188 domain-containing protein [Deinococcus taeanensis]UBV44720.1 DUF4188 domain-containing protein [Deinococcus taeanensis]
MTPALQRLTAEIDGDFVVFLIGMRINHPWKVRSWWPVIQAMPRMLRELQTQPELGLLGSHSSGLTQVQYWRSMAHLHRYATSREHAHLPAWRAFTQGARAAGGAVGIWHETYQVTAGAYETVYVNMPPTGLGRAGTLIPATGPRQTAQRRLTTATPAR